MMYLSQFGLNLAIGSKIEFRQCLFIKVYDAGDLEN